jgi:hypothetical protein
MNLSCVSWQPQLLIIGAYATYLDRAFYVDALVKADFLDIDIDAEDRRRDERQRQAGTEARP